MNTVNPLSLIQCPATYKHLSCVNNGLWMSHYMYKVPKMLSKELCASTCTVLLYTGLSWHPYYSIATVACISRFCVTRWIVDRYCSQFVTAHRLKPCVHLAWHCRRCTQSGTSSDSCGLFKETIKDISCASCTGYFPSSSDKDQPSGAIVQCLAVVQCILGYQNLDYLNPCLSELTKLAIFHELYYNSQDGGHLMIWSVFRPLVCYLFSSH